MIEKRDDDKYASLLVPSTKRPAAPEDGYLNTNNHLLAEFALIFLYSLLKKNFFDVKDVKTLEMLDPFIEIMKESIQSKHTNLVSLALKVRKRENLN